MQNIFDPLIKVYKTLYLFAYDITGNFGLALVLLSFFTFVVLYPFNKKSSLFFHLRLMRLRNNTVGVNSTSNYNGCISGMVIIPYMLYVLH